MATLYKADGTVQEVFPANGTFTLEELYQQVCAGDSDPIIEAVALENGDTLWCHEEGKLRDLPVNRNATEKFGHELPVVGDWLAGDVLITSPSESD